MATNQIIKTANSAILVFNNLPMGTLQAVRFNEDYAVQPYYGIGSIDPIENVPGAASYTVTANILQLLNDDLTKNGIQPSKSADMLTGNVFDILLMDKDTRQVLQKAVGCTFASGETELQANCVMARNITFKALAIQRV